MKCKDYQQYCTGCGLCAAVQNVPLGQDERGFCLPELTQQDLDFCGKVCPAGGAASALQSRTQLWGHYEGVFVGWSTDPEIRRQASSGGILTALCCYLLDQKLVDGVIQTCAHRDICYGTYTRVSHTKEDVLDCMGSRYSISSPLAELTSLIRPGKTYAIVGKPCDISALRMYLKDNRELAAQLPYLLSFFCAGVPSLQAQQQLLRTLDCSDPAQCKKLQYRGNGWPGYATAEKLDGSSAQISYEDSWGKILGRDVQKMCRFCLDGVGEFADVACGDIWHLTPDKKPDFTESDGQNIIFARTEAGNRLLECAMEAGYITMTDHRSRLDDLRYVQKYQYDRKRVMLPMVQAMKLCGKSAPNYDKATLDAFSAGVPVKEKVRRMLGMIKRVIKGKV